MSEVFSTEEFFAPMASDLVDNLVGRYQEEHRRVSALASVFADNQNGTAIMHFLEGNRGSHERFIRSVGEIFKLDGAVVHLNSSYWSQALAMTDVYEYMPNKRREEWNDQIRDMLTPEFEETTVRATLGELLNSRQKFFGERVDGIFKSLSGEHVTNRPEGFGKRMIISGVRNSYNSICYSTAGVIQDLRQVIAKFMGRDNPTHGSTTMMLEHAYRVTGQWVSIDGGAMRIRCYLKGTAHFEIHPDMAWRLNCVLASIYPAAIPPEFRQKPAKKSKEFAMILRPLPFAVINELIGLHTIPLGRWVSAGTGNNEGYREGVTQNRNNREFSYSDHDKVARAEAERVLLTIGATKMQRNRTVWYEFDYDPTEAIGEIISSGCIPDQKSHQFYPTPPALAERCAALAEIESNHSCLEPSAGCGGIADYLPKDQTTCVEISVLNSTVLDSKGFKVYQADFIKWSQSGGCYDRIVMNPPFSDGRALAHLQAAASLTKSGSRIVAILPAGMKNKEVLSAEWHCEWTEIVSNEFAGTSVSVVILIADHQ